MANKKSWVEKLKEGNGLPRVEKISPKLAKRWLAGRRLGEGRGTGTVAIPAPMEVNEIMKKVTKGKLITINEIRKIIAKKHKATIGCPITCGIFAWIAANAAEEERKTGKKDITPYWRTLKSDGSLNEKYPGSLEGQKKFLEKEGHKVIQKGKKYLVLDYEKSLAKL